MSLISIVQMYIFYNDISEATHKILSEDHNQLTPLEEISTYTSLGSYDQANPECHRNIVGKNRLLLDCYGDMEIQQIFDVNIFSHSNQICSSDVDRFKTYMSQ